ncbi:MAG: hypothetical protein MUC50_18170 [Myxococcota bacterium]|nr:hypothetical protein [Myxococcota bacterium]
MSTLQCTALAVCLCTLTLPARAVDQHLTSELSAQGYSVPRKDGEFLKQRRFVEDLGLSVWNLLPGSDSPYYRGPRLSFILDFRLSADAGLRSSEARPSVEDAYIPGAQPLEMQLLQARLAIEDLWNKRLDVSLGRLLRVDSLGLFALDGVQTVLTLPLHLELATYLGFEVRGGQVLGYDALELDGTDSGGRDDLLAGQYKDRLDPEPRLAIGTELAVSPTSFVYAALGFRAVGVGDALADQRIGGSLTLGNRPLRAELDAVYSVLLQKAESLGGRLVAKLGDPVTVSLGYEFWNPVFEADSIFNMFDLDPRNDLVVRVEARLSDALIAALWGNGRLAKGSAGVDGKREDSPLLGLGGGAGLDHRTPSRHLALRLSTMREWGEQRSSGEIGGEQRLLKSGRAWFGLRTSLWRVDSDFSPGPAVTFGGYVASVRFAFARGAQLLGEVEHYVGGGKGSRVTGLGLLRLDLWR